MNRWWDRANCHGMDPNLFFPSTNAPAGPEAQRACQECEVKSHCYVWSLHHEPFGYWAGTTERQRVRIRTIKGITVEELTPVYWMMLRDRRHGTYERYWRHIRDGEDPCNSCRDAYNAHRKHTRGQAQGAQDEEVFVQAEVRETEEVR